MSWVALKHFCLGVPEYGLNVSAESYALEGLRFIRTTDVTEWGGLAPVENAVFIDQKDADPSSWLQDGDLLFSRSGTLGRALLYRRSMGQAAFAGYLVRFRPRPENDPRYIYYCSLTDFFQNTVRSEAVSSTISNFNAERYANLRLPWCTPSKQRAIADFLDAETARIDSLIAKKCKLVQLLETRFQREIDHVMDSFDSSEAALGRFVLELGQGSSLQAGSRPADGEEWGVLKLSAVKLGRYDPRENKVLAKQPEELPMVPQVGDLLVTRSNTPAYVGDVAAVVHTTARRMLPDLIYRLRLDSARISAEFVAYALLTSRSRHRISALARGSSQSMVKLRGEDIRSLAVPVVTLSIQERTVASFERRRRQKSEIVSKLDQQIQLLVEHRQALITAAVTGEIGVLGTTIPQP